MLPLAQGQSAIDSAFQKFWAADSPVTAARAAADVVKAGVSFDDALRRLKTGRTYAAQKDGVVQMSNRTSDGIEHFFAVTIPAGYDPARQYQVRFQLHGGVGGREDNKPRGNGQIGTLAGATDQIYVIPYAWNDAPWWSDDQVLNLHAIVDALKRKYNVDENRVVVSGVSDGGTGAYYIAMRDTTPYASFLPLNGYIMVLANGEIDDGLNFPNNLREQASVRYQRRQGPAVPDFDRRALYAASYEERRRDRVPSAARGAAQHRVVAGDEGPVREICGSASARAFAGQAYLGSSRCGARPGALAGDRQLRRGAQRDERAHRRTPTFLRTRWEPILYSAGPRFRAAWIWYGRPTRCKRRPKA